MANRRPPPASAPLAAKAAHLTQYLANAQTFQVSRLRKSQKRNLRQLKHQPLPKGACIVKPHRMLNKQGRAVYALGLVPAPRRLTVAQLLERSRNLLTGL